jgi:hypothetical protein
VLPKHLDRAALAARIDQRRGKRARLDDLTVAVDVAEDEP